jgi:hypothetical protein
VLDHGADRDRADLWRPDPIGIGHMPRGGGEISEQTKRQPVDGRAIAYGMSPRPSEPGCAGLTPPARFTRVFDALCRGLVTTERTSFARSCGHNMGRWLLGSGSRGLRRPLGRNDDRGCCSMIAVDTCDCPAVDRETSLATPRMRPHRHRSGRSNGMRRAGRNGCARGRRLRADRSVGRDQSFVDARDRSFQSAPCFCQFIRMCRLLAVFLPSATA